MTPCGARCQRDSALQQFLHSVTSWALGAMAALYDEGIRVPKDVSVLGYDDLPCATRVRPALTTVHQPIDTIVRKSLELFSQSPQAIHTEILLPHSIVERQSCWRLNGDAAE